MMRLAQHIGFFETFEELKNPKISVSHVSDALAFIWMIEHMPITQLQELHIGNAYAASAALRFELLQLVLTAIAIGHPDRQNLARCAIEATQAPPTHSAYPYDR